MTKELADSPASEEPLAEHRSVADTRRDPVPDNPRRRRSIRVGALIVLAFALVAAFGNITWQWLDSLPLRTVRLEQTLGRHYFYAVSVSPDGKELMTSNLSRLPSGSEGSDLQLWEMPDCQSSKSLGSIPWRSQGVFSPCGQLIAIASVEDIRVLRRTTMQEVWRFNSEPYLLRDSPLVTFSPDGRWLATLGKGREVRIWDLADGSGPKIIPLGDWGRIAFSQKSDHLVIVGRFGCSVWNVEEMQRLSSFPIEFGGVSISDVAVSANGEMVGVIAKNAVANVWNIEKREKDSGVRRTYSNQSSQSKTNLLCVR